MSQWTHFLGIIRFDSMNKNVWPEPKDADVLVNKEADAIYRLFQHEDIPEGSEGPIEINVITTNRGPTVILTGDLRDYGKEDVEKVVPWLNEIIKNIRNHHESYTLFLRDGFIQCDIEYDKDLYLIEENTETSLFELNAYKGQRRRDQEG